MESVRHRSPFFANSDKRRPINESKTAYVADKQLVICTQDVQPSAIKQRFFFDNQMLINIREFQIITYLGHQLYTFLDVCFIEGEFVDIV